MHYLFLRIQLQGHYPLLSPHPRHLVLQDCLCLGGKYLRACRSFLPAGLALGEWGWHTVSEASWPRAMFICHFPVLFQNVFLKSLAVENASSLPFPF